MPNLITGLDIGSSQIKGIIAEQNKDGSLSVISAFKNPSYGFRKGVLVDVEDASRNLKELIRELKQISKDATRNVYTNLNSQHTKVRISRGISAVSQPDKEIKQEDVDRAIQSSHATKVLSNHKILHSITREFLVDDVGDIQDPVGMTGSRLEVSTLMVETFAPHFDILVNAIDKSGADISGVIFTPLASSKSTLSKQQKELGVFMIDIGFSTTTIAAYEENKPIFAVSLPIGANHITNDIAIGLKIPFVVAEKIKIAHGTASPRSVPRREAVSLNEYTPDLQDEISKRFLSEIIEIRVAEIIDIINNELKPLKSRFQFPAGVVVTGGGVKMDGFTDLVKERIKLPTQIGLPNIRDLEINNPTFENLIYDPEFSSAVGLVLLATEKHKRKNRSPRSLLRKIIKTITP